MVLAGNDQLIVGLMGGARNDEQDDPAAVDNHDTIDVSTSSLSSHRPSPNRPRRWKVSDFIAIMQMQMVQEAADRKLRAAEREEERKDRAQEARLERQERARDCQQMTELIATAIGGYIRHRNKKRKKDTRRRHAQRLGLDDSGESDKCNSANSSSNSS